MLILFDHRTRRDLIHLLTGHTIRTARQMAWERLANGTLLRAAEDVAFDLLLTTDQRIRYQQNLSGRKIAIIVLIGTSKWLRVQLAGGPIAEAVSASTPGSYTEVPISFR